MAKLSIVTPWHNAPELIPTYKRSTIGAELVIVDNASDAETGRKLHQLAVDSGGVYIYNKRNRPFGAANNQGLALASHDVILFLNNDIEAPQTFVKSVLSDVQSDGVLYGTELKTRQIGGIDYDYLAGYCIAATRQTWQKLGGWPELPGNYWEDNVLCLRAIRAGMKLQETTWRVWHYGNYTARKTAGAYEHSKSNYERFAREAVND